MKKQKIKAFSRRFSERDRYVCINYNSWARSGMPAPAGAKSRRLGEDLAQTNYGGLAGWWYLPALRQYASTAHPNYPISKRTNKIQRQPTTKTIFQKSFCGAFSKKRPPPHASPRLPAPPRASPRLPAPPRASPRLPRSPPPLHR